LHDDATILHDELGALPNSSEKGDVKKGTDLFIFQFHRTPQYSSILETAPTKWHGWCFLTLCGVDGYY